MMEGEYKEKPCPSPKHSTVDLLAGRTRIGTALFIPGKNPAASTPSKTCRDTSTPWKSTLPSISRFVRKLPGYGCGRFPTILSSCLQRNSEDVSHMSA